MTKQEKITMAATNEYLITCSEVRRNPNKNVPMTVHFVFTCAADNPLQAIQRCQEDNEGVTLHSIYQKIGEAD